VGNVKLRAIQLGNGHLPGTETSLYGSDPRRYGDPVVYSESEVPMCGSVANGMGPSLNIKCTASVIRVIVYRP
jgi:hypothetical protein